MALNLLSKWFLRQRQRSESFSSVYDILFSEQPKRYIEFRLRLFNLRVLFRFVIHLCFIYFLILKSWNIFFILTIFAYLLRTSSKAFFWGALESLRERVRISHRLYDNEMIASGIGAFVLLGLIIAILVTLIFLIFHYYFINIATQFGPVPNTSIFTILAYFLIFILWIDLPLMAYHSGIYAITRIMRPNFSIIAADCLFVVMFILFYPLMHKAAFVVAILVYILVSLGLKFYYTRRMYRLYEQPFTFVKSVSKAFTIIKDYSMKTFYLAGIAELSMRTDIMLLALVLIIGYYFQLDLFVVIFIYLISPMLRAATEWSKLFYFDRKRFEDYPLQRFVEKYDRYISRYAVLLGLLYWIIASATAYLILGEATLHISLLLLLYFILRPKIADAQVRAFSNRDYVAAIISGFILLAGLAFITFSTMAPLFRALSLALIMLFIYELILAKIKRSDFHRNYVYLNIYEWLDRLIQRKDEMSFCTIRLNDNINDWRRVYFIQVMIKKYFSDACVLTETARNELVFLEPSKSIKAIPSLNQIFELSGGLVMFFYYGKLPANEKLDLAELKTLPGIKKIFNNYDETLLNQLPDSKALKAYFLSQFPDGIYFDPYKHLGSEALDLVDAEARSLSNKIRYYLNQLSNRFKPILNEDIRNFDVTVLFEFGIIETVFLIAHPVVIDEEKTQRIKQWRQITHSYNLGFILANNPAIQSEETYNENDGLPQK